MRRNDREITDKTLIDQMILSEKVVRLGIMDNDKVYVVPMSFGYDGKAFYFHSALAGRKIDLLKKTHYATFELDSVGELVTGPVACAYSVNFESVIGEGRVEFIEDADEKRTALNVLMKHYTDKGDWDIPQQALSSVCCFKLIVENISMKKR